MRVALTCRKHLNGFRACNRLNKFLCVVEGKQVKVIHHAGEWKLVRKNNGVS